MDRSAVSAAVNISALARQIAQDIVPIGTVLEAHKLDNETWGRIQSDPNFQRMLADMTQNWNSAENTRERIKLKAQSAVEVALESLFADCVNTGQPLNHRTEALRQLARLGELEGAQSQGAVGAGINIQINIGSDKPPTIIEAQVVIPELENISST